MYFFEKDGIKIKVDADGFMLYPKQWNKKIARALASAENVPELTENHWKVIYFLREYFMENEIAPTIRKLLKETGFSLPDMYDLFPTGPAKGACKVAGLTKPTGCV